MGTGTAADLSVGWRRGDLSVGLSCLAIFVAIAATVSSVEYLPLHDYPAHIVRVEMMLDWPRFRGGGFYEFGSLFLPNVAMDVIVVGLARLIGVEWAGKLFLLLAMGLCLAGVASLQHTFFGRVGLTTILAAMLAINGIVMWGFVNYIFGLGLMLCAVAVWVRLKDDRRRFALGCVFALAIFFSHLVAFGLYALAIFGFEVQRLASRSSSPRAFLLAGVQFIAPVLLFLGMRTGAQTDGKSFTFAKQYSQKLEFIFRSFTTYVNLADFLLACAVLLLLALMAVGRARPSWNRAGTLMVAVPFLSFFVLPFSAFGSYFLDARIPIAVMFLGLACTNVRMMPPARERIVILLLTVIGVARVVSIAIAWAGYDDRYAAVDFSAVTPGDVIVVAGGPRGSGVARAEDWRPPMNSVASYAVLRGTFAAGHLADPRHQPIFATDRYRPLMRLQGSEPIPISTFYDLQQIVVRLRRLYSGPALLLVLRCHRVRGTPSLQRLMDNGRECLFRVQSDRAAPSG